MVPSFHKGLMKSHCYCWTTPDREAFLLLASWRTDWQMKVRRIYELHFKKSRLVRTFQLWRIWAYSELHHPAHAVPVQTTVLLYVINVTFSHLDFFPEIVGSYFKIKINNVNNVSNLHSSISLILIQHCVGYNYFFFYLSSQQQVMRNKFREVEGARGGKILSLGVKRGIQKMGNQSEFSCPAR